jgi:hypothetical protein
VPSITLREERDRVCEEVCGQELELLDEFALVLLEGWRRPDAVCDEFLVKDA